MKGLRKRFAAKILEDYFGERFKLYKCPLDKKML
jgi:hypothetical protein